MDVRLESIKKTKRVRDTKPGEIFRWADSGKTIEPAMVFILNASKHYMYLKNGAAFKFTDDTVEIIPLTTKEPLILHEA